MMAWETLATIPGRPGSRPLSLHRRGREYVIRAGGFELMSSWRSGSEAALARLAGETLDAPRPAPSKGFVGSGSARSGRAGVQRVLVGGLGMGFTARAALEAFPDARVQVVEIEARVVDWNRRWLAPLAGHPLDDPRLDVLVDDLANVIEGAAVGADHGRFDVILLDVDNGPEALSRRRNARLYSSGGLTRTARALRLDGLVAYWSAGPDDAFGKRLVRAMERVETHRVPAGVGSRARARHTIWLARPRAREHPSA